MGRQLSETQQKQFFEDLGDPHDLDVYHMTKLFARSRKTGIKYYMDDEIVIGPEHSKFVGPNSRTTVGIYICNKYLWEGIGIFGYINHMVDGGINGKIDNALSKAMMDGDINCQQYAEFIDRSQYLFGGPMGMIINTSVSETIFTLPEPAKKKREELFAKYKEQLDANNPQVAAHIEHEIVDVAMEEMRKKNDPAMAIFDADAGVKPYNQYKTIFVMKGAIVDNTGESSTGYKIVKSNYDTSITKEDMPKIADAVVTSAYAGGVSTQDSGTNGKKYNALFQNIRIQERGSDCGTKDTLPTLITDDYIYRWIVDNGKLVLLDQSNIDKYKGKVMPMRSGVHCKAKYPEYCSKCIGDRPYRIGTRNIGLAFMSISGSTLNAALKTKHDISIKLYKVTMDDIMKYVN